MSTCILFQFQACLSGHVNSPEQKLRVNCMDSISRMQLEISAKLMYLYIKIPQLSTMM